MSIVAKDLSAADKRAVAEYLGRATDPAEPTPDEDRDCARCFAPPADPVGGPRWIGWGADLANTRFQPRTKPGFPSMTSRG